MKNRLISLILFSLFLSGSENETMLPTLNLIPYQQTIESYIHEAEKHKARYLKLNVLHNSANPSLRITRF